MLPQRQALTTGCCAHRGSHAALRPRSGYELVAGAASLAIWALMPKCPACLAAYIALWTGLGLSLTTTAYLRWGFLALSGVMVIYLAAKWLRRAQAKAAEGT